MDPIGWFIATTHQMLGHDKTAQIIGMAPGSKIDCILCRFESSIATKEEVVAQIGTGELWNSTRQDS